MIPLYRATRSVSIPYEILATRLDTAFERVDRTHWRHAMVFGLCETSVFLDRQQGKVSMSVATRDGYRWLGFMLVVTALVTLAVEQPSWINGGLIMLAGSLTVLPFIGYVPGTPMGDLRRWQGLTLETEHLTKWIWLPYLATFIAIADAISPGSDHWAVWPLLGALAIVGMIAIAFAGGVGREDALIKTVGLSLSGLVVPLLTMVNLLLVQTLVNGENGVWRVLPTIAILSLSVFPFCAIVLDQLQRSNLGTPRQIWSRWILGGMFVFIVSATLAVTVLAGSILIETTLGIRPSIPSVLFLSESLVATMDGRLRAVGVLIVAIFPLVIILLSWLAHIGTVFALHLWVWRHGRVIEAPVNAPEGLWLVSMPIGRAVVRPVGFFGLSRPTVLVDETVQNRLTDNELAAVCWHEYHHLSDRSLTMAVFGGLTGTFFGGRNAWIAFFDVRASEVAADRRAIQAVGASPFILALRKLSDAQAPLAQPPGNLLMRTLKAPYRLYFGSVLFDRARPSIQERIAMAQALDNPS